MFIFHRRIIFDLWLGLKEGFPFSWIDFTIELCYHEWWMVLKNLGLDLTDNYAFFLFINQIAINDYIGLLFISTLLP